MDMNMPAISAGSATSAKAIAASTATGQTKTEGGAAFQQKLFYHMSSGNTGETNGAASAAATGSPSLSVADAAVDSVNADLTLAETMDLIAMIEGLIEELIAKDEQTDAAEVDEKSLEQMQSVLEQLNALLALLGAPVIEWKDVQLSGDSADGESVQANASTQVKLQLQESLYQLQSLLQEGGLKQVQQQEPLQLIGQQLQAIEKVLQKQKVQQNNAPANLQSQTDAAADQTAEVQVTQSAASSTTSMLQRLSQQAIHPSVLIASTGEEGTESATQSMTAETAEAGTAAQTGPVFGDLVRSAAIHPSAKALLQPYVAADQFADTMSEFVQKLDFKVLNGATEATIQLFPEQLGQVDIRITVQNGQLTAVFHTDTVSAKDVLDNQMAQLRAALQAQGLSVDKLEVTQGQAAAHLSNGYLGQGAGQQSFTGQNKSKGSRIADDAAVFENDVVEQLAIQDMGYGRAVNVTA
ncbi:flagellar hook-length control protein FliK [Paenibacillus sp. NEAU-GSW1]|uniref:flagellar hook-length control protein FliK n=1 Tax=Paenibacillus sp. NEAU-GSW1 TaxID=2682486 RepID=UPI0012E0DB42|nr:flagellar hook-length control protein FliK [Paenibacillus sp. NEAU-GSW1]MUT66356.1 hypothetical protein [Paenibacillus sp. NEAU-GSW1]